MRDGIFAFETNRLFVCVYVATKAIWHMTHIIWVSICLSIQSIISKFSGFFVVHPHFCWWCCKTLAKRKHSVQCHRCISHSNIVWIYVYIVRKEERGSEQVWFPRIDWVWTFHKEDLTWNGKMRENEIKNPWVVICVAQTKA